MFMVRVSRDRGGDQHVADVGWDVLFLTVLDVVIEVEFLYRMYQPMAVRDMRSSYEARCASTISSMVLYTRR